MEIKHNKKGEIIVKNNNEESKIVGMEEFIEKKELTENEKKIQKLKNQLKDY